jgi:hypothetical protein
VTILLGIGDGTFTQKADLSTGIFPPRLAVGNFGGTNGDLVVTNGLNTSPQATFFCERWERQLRPERKSAPLPGIPAWVAVALDGTYIAVPNRTTTGQVSFLSAVNG